MIVLISGGFDPIHEGHLDLIEAASALGEVHVALNSEAWLVRKKGYAFQRWAVRARILSALKLVERVHAVDDSDDTVCEALRRIQPAYFANGGDRKRAEARENTMCRLLGIEQVFGVGGEKVQSSSELVRNAA